MDFFIQYSVFFAMPILFVHLALDLFDKHRHGIKVHDFIGIVTYLVLAVHIGFDILGLVAQ
jgi:hypothetical protein